MIYKIVFFLDPLQKLEPKQCIYVALITRVIRFMCALYLMFAYHYCRDLEEE